MRSLKHGLAKGYNFKGLLESRAPSGPSSLHGVCPHPLCWALWETINGCSENP